MGKMFFFFNIKGLSVRKRNAFSNIMMQQLDIYMGKQVNIALYLKPYTTLNLKATLDLSIKTRKLLKEIWEESLCVLEIGKPIFDRMQNAWTIFYVVS